MTQIVNFKRMEVTGATEAEALAKAPFNIMGDATQAYKRWKKQQTKGITDSDVKKFMLDYLAKKSKNTPGNGYSITIESAAKDTRKRPYKITNVKNEKGSRESKTVYQIIDRETKQILAQTKPGENRAQARELAKKLVLDGFHGKADCVVTKQVTKGEPVVFTVEYTPSVTSRIGTYLVFGMENN